MRIAQVNPKCGPVVGGTELVMVVDIDQQMTKYLFNLCVGFQARNQTQTTVKLKKTNQEEKKEDKKEELESSKNIVRKSSRMGSITPGGSKIGGGALTGASFTGNPINPLEPNEQQLEMDCWHCSTANYEAGRITCQYYHFKL